MLELITLYFQSGKHDELMAKKGLYYELVSQQEKRANEEASQEKENVL